MSEDTTDNTREKTTGGPRRGFQPGQSGNPLGRPKGAKSAEIRALLDRNAADVMQRVIDAALTGDIQACRIVIERVSAPKRSNPIFFDIPKVTNIDEARHAMSLIIEGQTDGTLSADEADALVKTVQAFINVVEVAEIEERIKRIEDGHS